jgi:hypothetical protein
MDITEHVDALRRDLAQAARAMGPELEQAAERLGYALDSSARLALMDALSHAAAEITNELDGTSVEVRLQGREPVFVVVGGGPSAVAPDDTQAVHTDDTTVLPDDEGAETARITLRLPEALKGRAEELAGQRGQSLNTWIVNAVRAATSSGFTVNVGPTGVQLGPGAPGRNRSSNKRVQGWVR